MKFDKDRVYTALNADALSSYLGKEVIVDDTMHDLKENVIQNKNIGKLSEIRDEAFIFRFVSKADCISFIGSLCYLLPEPEPEPEPEPL